MPTQDDTDKPQVKEVYYFIKAEGVIGSWLRDSVTFGSLVGVTYFEHVMLKGGFWWDAIAAILWFFFVLGRATAHRNKMRLTPTEARKWLDEKYPQHIGKRLIQW